MIWAAILQSRIVRWIGAAVAGALAVLTFGAVKKREGRIEERAAEAARQSEAFRETIQEVTHETADPAEPSDAIRQRLRDRAKRKP